MTKIMQMTTGIAAGTMAGIAVGTALGLAAGGTNDRKSGGILQNGKASGKSRKGKSAIGKITSKALCAMGDAFHNVADIVS